MPIELCLDCPECGGPRPCEQPPCPDGHGADCPERVCLECGTAFVLPVCSDVPVRAARPRAA